MQILFPSFGQEVLDVLNTSNIPYSIDGNAIMFPRHGLRMVLVPLDSDDRSQADADSTEVFFLYEDRWRNSRVVTSQRMLSRLGIFRRIHARLCKVVSMNNCRDFGLTPESFTSKARKFLDAFHAYGYLKGQEDYLLLHKGDIVAAAQFMKTYQPKSSINPNQDKDSQLKSFEWTRYASLPDVRIAGGMGKVLNQFLSDVHTPQKISFEVMSYSDNEWSSGDAYRKLGFKLAGTMEPVTYHIDPKTWKRINPRQWAALKTRLTDKNADTYTTIQNQGSRKWVLLIGDGIL